eukprot:1159643-Pelagomonas_calceolata.AAC.5
MVMQRGTMAGLVWALGLAIETSQHAMKDGACNRNQHALPGANTSDFGNKEEKQQCLVHKSGVPCMPWCNRSYDPVAPIIHEWTYEAMVYDLLEVDDNVYRCVAAKDKRLASACRHFGKLEWKKVWCWSTASCSVSRKVLGYKQYPTSEQKFHTLGAHNVDAPLREWSVALSPD